MATSKKQVVMCYKFTENEFEELKKYYKDEGKYEAHVKYIENLHKTFKTWCMAFGIELNEEAFSAIDNTTQKLKDNVLREEKNALMLWKEDEINDILKKGYIEDPEDGYINSTTNKECNTVTSEKNIRITDRTKKIIKMIKEGMSLTYINQVLVAQGHKKLTKSAYYNVFYRFGLDDYPRRLSSFGRKKKAGKEGPREPKREHVKEILSMLKKGYSRKFIENWLYPVYYQKVPHIIRSVYDTGMKYKVPFNARCKFDFYNEIVVHLSDLHIKGHIDRIEAFHSPYTVKDVAKLIKQGKDTETIIFEIWSRRQDEFSGEEIILIKEAMDRNIYEIKD